MNDISCDVHGSSNMDFIIAFWQVLCRCCRYYFNIILLFYRSERREEKKWHMCVFDISLFPPSFLCLGCCRLLLTLQKRSLIYQRCSLSSVNVQYVYTIFIYCPINEINVNSKAYKPYVCVWLSPRALLMHFCNEIYRFIVDTSHDFLECMRALLSTAFKPPTNDLYKRRNKNKNTHTQSLNRQQWAHTKIY